MNNFDLHKEAQQLADTKTAYELARELVELLNEMAVTQDRLLKANKEISRLSLENTFELHKIRAEAVQDE